MNEIFYLEAPEIRIDTSGAYINGKFFDAQNMVSVSGKEGHSIILIIAAISILLIGINSITTGPEAFVEIPIFFFIARKVANSSGYYFVELIESSKRRIKIFRGQDKSQIDKIVNAIQRTIETSNNKKDEILDILQLEIEQEVTGSKYCPMCAEAVKKAAIVCRFCGYRFE